MKKIWRQNKAFILFIILMVMFRTTLADWNTVPTGSMKPTIMEGDRIWVNRVAYDLRLPFSNISLMNFNRPKRWEIVIFDSQAAAKRLVKRVVGVPGDVLSMRNDRLLINGQAVSYDFVSKRDQVVYYKEKMGDKEHLIRLSQERTPLSDFGPITVPEDTYFVLGDNRHNSADSRIYGFVSHTELIGRSRSVVMSLDYEDYYLPRPERFFHAME